MYRFYAEGGTMEKLKKLSTVFIIFTLASALICIAKAQASAENMKTFFDSEIPGIKIQVNATAETQPAKNVTVILTLKGKTDVYMESFSLSIFGFLRGKDKTQMAIITDNDFSLNNTSIRKYNCTFKVPQEVWGVIYGEISLKYSAKLGGLEIIFPLITCGFTMTHVENVHLKDMEERLKNLNASYQQLNDTYWGLNSTFEQLYQAFWESFQMNLTAENFVLLNQTFWELHQNYTSLNQTYWDLKGSIGGLDTTTNVAIVLAITTVCFAATTIYLMMRKPKQYW